MSTSFQTGESIETRAQHREYLKKHEYKYRHHFKTYDSYEIFMMLPIDDAGRDKLLTMLKKEHLCATSESSIIT
jgi:hypothetical protein